MDWFQALAGSATAHGVLTAMITPAVLISGCGALVISTAARMGRVIDRVRFISRQLEDLIRQPDQDDMASERRPVLQAQLTRQTARARLLQRSLVAFYSALGVFVATSLAIAITSVTGQEWAALVLGLLGATFMLYGCVLLIFESRMALSVVVSEVEFLAQVSRRFDAGRPGGDTPGRAAIR